MIKLKDIPRAFYHNGKRFLNDFHYLTTAPYSYIDPVKIILKRAVKRSGNKITALTLFKIITYEYFNLIKEMLINEKRTVRFGVIFNLAIVQVDEGLPGFKYNIDYGGRGFIICVSFNTLKYKKLIGDFVAIPVGEMADELKEALKRGETFISFTDYAKKSSQLLKYDVHHAP